MSKPLLLGDRRGRVHDFRLRPPRLTFVEFFVDFFASPAAWERPEWPLELIEFGPTERTVETPHSTANQAKKRSKLVI